MPSHSTKISSFFAGDVMVKRRLPSVRILFVCFTNRCGSNLLCEALASTGVFPLGSECLNHEEVEQASKACKISNFHDYFERLIKADSKNGWFVVKAGPNQLKFMMDWGYLSSVEYQLIVLSREDVLAQAISLSIAEQTGSWTSEFRQSVAATYSTRKIKQDIKTIEFGNNYFSEFVRKTDVPTFFTVYEKLVNNMQHVISAFGDFVKIPLSIDQSQITLKKQASAINEEWRQQFLSDAPAFLAENSESIGSSDDTQSSSKKLEVSHGNHHAVKVTWPIRNADIFDHVKATQSPEFTSRFCNAPSIISRWIEKTDGRSLDGMRVLDFGCGPGLTAHGIAMFSNPELVHGVDLRNESQKTAKKVVDATGLRIPSNISFEKIASTTTGSLSGYDLVYSWSVFEHIDLEDIDGCLASIREAMNPDGLLFIQIAPLYYSPEGSHLWALGFRNWEHLSQSREYIEQRLIEKLGKKASSLLGMYDQLNRITADQLLSKVEQQGFLPIRVQRNQVNLPIPSELASAFSEDDLLTDQIVVLCKR